MATRVQTYDAPDVSRESAFHDRPKFSRIVSKGRPTSWTLGIPITAVFVLLIALAAFFASKASSYHSELATLRTNEASARQGLEAAQKRLGTLEGDMAIANSPGMGTVTLQPTKASNGAWASAVWGESTGKGFVALRAYGLRDTPSGKAYHAWFQGSGEQSKPQLLGALEPDATGAAFVQGKDFASTAKGGRVFVTLDDESAKTASENLLMEAKLQPPGKAEAAEE